MSDYSKNDFINIIKPHLNSDRFHHSICVAECAENLAKLYGGDEEKAFTAGILHDIMKNTSDEKQLEVINQNGIKLNDVELSNPKLYHAISGSVYVRTELNISDEDILNAIRYHTTGRAGMSLLEKIIYVADFVSEDRSYNGIEEIREASLRSLEEAMMIGLEFSIQEITNKKQTLHLDSVSAYNELILRGQK